MSAKLSCLFLLALSLKTQTVPEREVSTTTNNKLTETLVALKDPGAPRAFLDFSPRGVEGVFNSAQVIQLISILDSVRQTAAVPN
jgi:hypothetical protein